MVSSLLCSSHVFLMFEPTLSFLNDMATTEIYTLSLHDALPISGRHPVRGAREASAAKILRVRRARALPDRRGSSGGLRSEEHTSELQSRQYLVCRLLLEKKKKEYGHQAPALSRTVARTHRVKRA